MYKSLPALWKIKSKDYSDRQKKYTMHETVFTKYLEYYKEGTKKELKKIIVLRTNSSPKESPFNLKTFL